MARTEPTLSVASAHVRCGVAGGATTLAAKARGRDVRILVVEDERKVARAPRDGLEAEHYDVRVATTGEEGFFLVNHETFDLVVLDLMLPRRDGIGAQATLVRCCASLGGRQPPDVICHSRTPPPKSRCHRADATESRRV